MRKRKTTRRRWSDAEIAILRERYPDQPTASLLPLLPGRTIKTIQEKSVSIGVHKTREFLAAQGREAMARPGHPAHQTRFVKGAPAWNKGISYQPGGRSVDTRFPKGTLSGNAALNKKPLGFERISKDGYLERKINEDRPFNKRWRFVHLILWESVNGPLPEGHALVFRNGDKTDIRLDNLELITRSDLLRRNSTHRYGPDIARLSQLKGAITRQINRRKDHEQHHQ